jgi:thiamine-monophosphate kinase
MPGSHTVGEAGEHAILALIRSHVGPTPPWVVLGIGDDAAVVEPARNHLEVLTSDVQVEGVHFDRHLADSQSIGYKALAVNLSDLAAMGAAPRAALLSLGLPAALEMADLDALLRGFSECARRYAVTLIGGNISRSPGPLFLDVTLTGSVKRRKMLSRHGGRVGDALYVTGSLGAATVGLSWLQTGGRPIESHGPSGSSSASDVMDAATRFLRPEPRLRFGVIVGRTRAASACIDLSDGLADAVRQLAQASGAGASIDATAIPVAAGAVSMLGAEQALQVALRGGEDYELLLAVPRKATRRLAAAAKLGRVTVTRIGVLTSGAALVVRDPSGEHGLPSGFQHFSTAPAALPTPQPIGRSPR